MNPSKGDFGRNAGYNEPDSPQQTLVVFNGASSWGEPFIIVMVGTLLTMPLLGPVGILQNRVAAHFMNDEESDQGEDDAEAVEMQRMDRGLVQEADVVGGRDDRCSCGAPHVAGSKFCNERDDRCSCGAPPLVCSCGSPWQTGNDFCDQCGAAKPQDLARSKGATPGDGGTDEGSKQPGPSDAVVDDDLDIDPTESAAQTSKAGASIATMTGTGRARARSVVNMTRKEAIRVAFKVSGCRLLPLQTAAPCRSPTLPTPHPLLLVSR
jgi:hypothetical protein